MAKKAKKRAVRKAGKKKVHVIDLKKLKTVASLKKELKKASRKKVAIITVNAPFRLAA